MRSQNWLVLLVAGVLALGCGRSDEARLAVVRAGSASVAVRHSAAESQAGREVEQAVAEAVLALRADQAEDQLSRVNRHFANVWAPVPQEGLTDARALVREDQLIAGSTVSELRFRSVAVNGDRASVRFRESLAIRNPSGPSGMGSDHAWELVRQEGRWLVCGFSTFPDSAQREAVEQAVSAWLQPLARGGRPPHRADHAWTRVTVADWAARRKLPRVDQVQFWAFSEPHLAGAVDRAVMAKVTLVDGDESFYLLVDLEGGAWRPGVVRPAAVRASKLY